jgi:DNA-directed RNA polymerase specialized sigma24 family protein
MGDQRTPARSREQRFTELFTVCYGPILAFARRRLDPDLAQDIVADTFLTAWRRFDELSGEPLPWLYGVETSPTPLNTPEFRNYEAAANEGC